MDIFVGYGFRFCMYMMFGLCMETVFSIHGIDVMLGYRVDRRVPRKYLEGFVSAYMIPLHGLGVLFGFEFLRATIAHWHVGFRYAAYCIGITFAEVAWGFVCDKVLGFYSWDYYAGSRFRMFKRGYTLWTLLPAWGIAGLVLEFYTDLMIHLTPAVVEFVGS